jgi:5'-nucleotidase (lipoprotein e(P4) family)
MLTRQITFRLLFLSLVFTYGCACRIPHASAVAGRKPTSLAIHWVRDSAEYRALVQQAYASAGHMIESRAETLQPRHWGIIVDTDETLLDNSEFQRERRGEPFSDEMFSQWVRRKESKAIPGARAFLARVRALGGIVVVVTNRKQSLCADTETNLKTEGLQYDAIACRPDTSEDDGKTARFQAIQAGTAIPGLGPIEVAAWLGDDIRDFPELSQSLRSAADDGFALFGDLYFMLPNPMYGSWTRNPER